MIVCTCSVCITKTFTDKNGDKHHGQFVTRAVQLRHHLTDLEVSPVHPPSREASPKPQLLDDDQESHYAPLNTAFEELQLDGQDPSLTVVTLVAIFLGWLHLFCGVSRAKRRMARDFVLEILGLARCRLILLRRAAISRGAGLLVGLAVSELLVEVISLIGVFSDSILIWSVSRRVDVEVIIMNI